MAGLLDSFLVISQLKPLRLRIKENEYILTFIFIYVFVAFAWLKCEGEVGDCESFLRKHKIYTRGGKHFGASTEYTRISMLSRDSEFKLFTERLPAIMS